MLKKHKDIGCPNTQRRMHVCLTPKELDTIELALKSASAVRSTEVERAYLRRLLRKLERQVAV